MNPNLVSVAEAVYQWASNPNYHHVITPAVCPSNLLCVGFDVSVTALPPNGDNPPFDVFCEFLAHGMEKVSLMFAVNALWVVRGRVVRHYDETLNTALYDWCPVGRILRTDVLLDVDDKRVFDFWIA